MQRAATRVRPGVQRRIGAGTTAAAGSHGPRAQSRARVRAPVKGSLMRLVPIGRVRSTIEGVRATSRGVTSMVRSPSACPHEPLWPAPVAGPTSPRLETLEYRSFANPKGPIAMSRQLMIPAADTQLYAIETPGGAPPLLFLSGGFATVQTWDHVIRRLDQKYRAVRFDARARGKSGTSADYSVRAAVDDIGRVIDATEINRPILVGWSYGATIAVRYAAQHPEQWAAWY